MNLTDWLAQQIAADLDAQLGGTGGSEFTGLTDMKSLTLAIAQVAANVASTTKNSNPEFNAKHPRGHGGLWVKKPVTAPAGGTPQLTSLTAALPIGVPPPPRPQPSTQQEVQTALQRRIGTVPTLFWRSTWLVDTHNGQRAYNDPRIGRQQFAQVVTAVVTRARDFVTNPGTAARSGSNSPDFIHQSLASEAWYDRTAREIAVAMAGRPADTDAQWRIRVAAALLANAPNTPAQAPDNGPPVSDERGHRGNQIAERIHHLMITAPRGEPSALAQDITAAELAAERQNPQRLSEGQQYWMSVLLFWLANPDAPGDLPTRAQVPRPVWLPGVEDMGPANSVALTRRAALARRVRAALVELRALLPRETPEALFNRILRAGGPQPR